MSHMLPISDKAHSISLKSPKKIKKELLIKLIKLFRNLILHQNGVHEDCNWYAVENQHSSCNVTLKMLHQQYHEYFPSQANLLGNSLCDLTSILLPRKIKNKIVCLVNNS